MYLRIDNTKKNIFIINNVGYIFRRCIPKLRAILLGDDFEFYVIHYIFRVYLVVVVLSLRTPYTRD